MKRNRMIPVIVIGIFSISCVEAATPEELKLMCENLISLRGKLVTPDVKTLEGEVESDFQEREARLKGNLEKATAALDGELNAKLAELEKEDEIEALKKEYEALKKAKNEEFAPSLEELVTDKTEALKEAAAKARGAKSKWDAAIEKCLGEAEKEGTPKPVAKCRISATSVDEYWNRCR